MKVPDGICGDCEGKGKVKVIAKIGMRTFTVKKVCKTCNGKGELFLSQLPSGRFSLGGNAPDRDDGAGRGKDSR